MSMCWIWKGPAGAAHTLLWCSWLAWKPAHVRSHKRRFTLASLSSSSSSFSLWEIIGQEWNPSLSRVNLTKEWTGWWGCQTMHHQPHFAVLKLHENHTCKGNHLNIMEVPNPQKFSQKIGMMTLQGMLPWGGASNATGAIVRAGMKPNPWRCHSVLNWKRSQ